MVEKENFAAEAIIDFKNCMVVAERRSQTDRFTLVSHERLEFAYLFESAAFSKKRNFWQSIFTVSCYSK